MFINLESAEGSFFGRTGGLGACPELVEGCPPTLTVPQDWGIQGVEIEIHAQEGSHSRLYEVLSREMR